MRRTRTVAAVGTGVLVVALAGVLIAQAASGSDQTGGDQEQRTATVERTTLTSGLSLAGQLGYGGAQEVGGAGGVVTSLPAAGDQVSAGEALYSVDGHPALVVQGDTPLWRKLSLGDTGQDVLGLRAALAGLGYAVDNGSTTYDVALANAVAAAFRDRGFAAPVDTAAADTARREAQAAVDQATSALATATSARDEKLSGPTAGDLAEARAAVSAAERALAAAQAGTPAATAQPSGEAENSAGTTTGSEVLGVPAATEQLAVAQARLSDLTRSPVSSAERTQVATAQAALDRATEDLRAAEAGTVGPADLVVVPTGAVRVHQVLTAVGRTAEGPVLSWTGTTLYAFASLTAAQARDLTTGTAAVVKLPDGSTAEGTIAAISEAGTNADGTAIAPQARVDLTDPAAADSAGTAAVTVTVPAEEAADALVVPVTALLALSEGGYALEVVDPGADGGTRLVGVEVGLVADARVEVITDQVEAGDEVVVP